MQKRMIERGVAQIHDHSSWALMGQRRFGGRSHKPFTGMICPLLGVRCISLQIPVSVHVPFLFRPAFPSGTCPACERLGARNRTCFLLRHGPPPSPSSSADGKGMHFICSSHFALYRIKRQLSDFPLAHETTILDLCITHARAHRLLHDYRVLSGRPVAAWLTIGASLSPYALPLRWLDVTLLLRSAPTLRNFAILNWLTGLVAALHGGWSPKLMLPFKLFGRGSPVNTPRLMCYSLFGAVVCAQAQSACLSYDIESVA